MIQLTVMSATRMHRGRHKLVHMYREEDEFMYKRGKYHASRQNHLTLSKKSRDHTSQHLQVEDESILSMTHL